MDAREGSISLEQQRNGRFVKRAAPVFLIAGSVAVSLLLLEGALRIVGLQDPVVYRSDPVYGYEPRPSQSANRLGIPIYIKDIGLRDNRPLSALLKSKTRVLVIGNSVTYGGSRVRQKDLRSGSAFLYS